MHGLEELIYTTTMQIRVVVLAILKLKNGARMFKTKVITKWAISSGTAHQNWYVWQVYIFSPFYSSYGGEPSFSKQLEKIKTHLQNAVIKKLFRVPLLYVVVCETK